MNSEVRKLGVKHAPLGTAAAWLEKRVDKATKPTRHTSIKAKKRLLKLRFLVNLGWDIEEEVNSASDDKCFPAYRATTTFRITGEWRSRFQTAGCTFFHLFFAITSECKRAPGSNEKGVH